MTTLRDLIPKKRLWIPILILIVLGVAAWITVTIVASQHEADQATKLKTLDVWRGDIRVSVSGSGFLVAGSTADLTFVNPGTLEVLNVQVGDKVEADDVLAQLDGLEELQVDLETKQLALDTEQDELQDFLDNTSQTLAEAQLACADAQEAYQEAIENLRYEGQSRCDQETKDKYYEEYIWAYFHYNEWAAYLDSGSSGYGTDYILTKMEPYKDTRDQAAINLAYCAGYTQQEIDESEANLKMAEANLEKAKSLYEELKQTSGLDLDELNVLELEVKNAQAQLAVAQSALEGVTLITPIDGTVLSIAAEVGENVEAETDEDDEEIGMDTFMTIADLEYPLVEIYIDAVDMASLNMGSQVEVIFDAIPERIFYGTVTQVEPMLATQEGVDVLQGMVDLLDDPSMKTQTMLIGMRAYVEVIEGEAKDTLLIPQDALSLQDDGSTMVSVLDENGVITQRLVEVGLMDYVNVQIVSGLEEGETLVIENDMQ